jgi:hypothetical protein
MSNNIDLLREMLCQIYQRRPALKKKMLVALTSVLITTPANKLRDIAYLGGEIEECFVDVLTKYVKRNPAAAGSLSNICNHSTQLFEIVLDVLNTKASPLRCIQQGYNGSYTNLNIIRERIENNLLGEENESR